jgi:hypothetical protein
MRSRLGGVSLIELIVVIVAMTVGIVTLGSAYLLSARSVKTNEDIQIAWQVAQACADHTYGRVRRPGAFANVVAGSNPCSLLPANGTVRTVTVTDMAGGTEPCAGAAWSCRQVLVTVTRGGYSATVNFMFLDD